MSRRHGELFVVGKRTSEMVQCRDAGLLGVPKWVWSEMGILGKVLQGMRMMWADDKVR